jgi:hypothetical protein
MDGREKEIGIRETRVVEPVSAIQNDINKSDIRRCADEAIDDNEETIEVKLMISAVEQSAGQQKITEKQPGTPEDDSFEIAGS